MRVIRFYRSPEREHDEPPSLSLIDDRLLSFVQHHELRLHDLDHPEHPILIMTGVADFARSTSCLIVQRLDGALDRFDHIAGNWQHARRLLLPIVPESGTSLFGKLIISPSGRYLVVDSIPCRRPSGWQVSRAFLLNAFTRHPIRTFDLGISHVRANFATVPSGSEVLFISAASDMSVQMVDCATGEIRHEYLTPYLTDFCHTDYWLSPDATRRAVFGRVWGAPYQFRLYTERSQRSGTPAARKQGASGRGVYSDRRSPCLDGEVVP